MRLNETILHALRQAVLHSGGAKELAAKCHISASNISRYLNGKVSSITDECWERLQPFLELPSLPHTSGTVANTPELRAFLTAAMHKSGISTIEQLRRAIGYNSGDSLRRICDGELTWFPDE